MKFAILIDKILKIVTEFDFNLALYIHSMGTFVEGGEEKSIEINSKLWKIRKLNFQKIFQYNTYTILRKLL